MVTTQDRMIPPAAQRTMSRRAGSDVVEVAGSHSIYVSHGRSRGPHQAGRHRREHSSVTRYDSSRAR